MTLAASIKTDPLLFDKLLEPLQQPLAEFAKHPLSQVADKLTVVVFVRLLLFRLFAQTRSARDLLTDVQSSPTAQALGFFKLGLSTFHDGVGRYPQITPAHGTVASNIQLSQRKPLALTKCAFAERTGSR